MNSGFQVVWTNWPQSHVGALIPALFWSVERAYTERRLKDAVPVAAVVATMFLEGFPAVTMYSLLAAGAYLAVRLVSERPVRIRLRVPGGVFAALGVALGAGLATFELLPFVFHLKNLNLAYRVFQQHLPRYALETLVIPNALGSPAARTWFAPTSNYVELQSFIGATALLLVIAGLVRRREHHRDAAPGVWGFVYGAIAVTGLLIYGGGPLLKIVQSLPLLGMNWIGRLRAVFLFLMSVAAAIGFVRVTDRVRELRRRPAELLMWAGVAVVGVLLVFHIWGVVRARPERAYVLRQCVIPVLAGGAALALVVAATSSARWRRLAAFFLPVLVAIECVAFVLPFWPRVPRSEFYPVTAAHKFVLDHLDGARLAASGITMYSGTTTVYGIRSVTSHTFQNVEWNDLMTAVDPAAFAALGPTHPVFAPTRAVASSPVLDRLNARYFAVDPMSPILGHPEPLPSTSGTVTLRPERPLEVRVAGRDVRGVTVYVTDLGRERVRPLLTAQVLDARGAVVGSGTRRVPAEFRRGELNVPVAGEPDGGRVRLSVSDSSGVTLRASVAGGPAAAPVLGGRDGLRLAFAGPAVIYERLHALPRVRWMRSARVVPKGPDRLQILKTGGVSPDTVLLDEPGAPAASGRDGHVRVTRDDTDSLAISVDAQGAGYVEIADDMQHGWKAAIDGRPAPLLDADHALVAVATPAGHHEIRVWYHPKGFKGGVLISLVSVLLTLAALVSSRLGPRFMKQENA
jgi:hypothetical protein